MKIEKLELKHLTPYSNCGLIWDFVGTQVTTLGIVGETLYTTDGGVLNWTKHPDYPTALTPILRPLRLLTEEIIHEGEKFVPIERIIQMTDFGQDYKNSLIWDHRKLTVKTDFIVVKSKVCREFIVHLSDSIKHNEYWINQALLELKFDIYNLIESGFAIDSTTVGNPYDKQT